MGPLSNLADNLQRERENAHLCKIGRYRASLPDLDERDALDRILSMLSAREAASVLSGNHILEVGSTLIAEHKRGVCACH